MSPTCKLKTFHEYKALISFKFGNKDSIIRKTSRKFPMHYVNTKFDFGGNSLIKEGKYLVIDLVIESSYFLCRVIKMKFYRFIAAFLFFGR